MVVTDELKAGHPAATKVGGARRRTRSKSDNAATAGGLAGAELPEEQPEGGEVETSESKELVDSSQDVVPPYKENTVEAVKAFHEKPAPTKQQPHVKQTGAGTAQSHIHQPRK